MDELTITITVGDWLDHTTDHAKKERTLRNLGDHLLTLACRKADDLGIAIHVEHNLEY